tara:strand:- start:17228 stop:17563 length:336 start_codon:yes stop_codon:yes gene_type:complete
MRKLNLFLVAAMLLATGTIFANNGTLVDKPAKKLSAQIADLLKNNAIIVKEGDLTGTVLFTLNEDKEIVILSVKTDNENLEQFVKSRLNYRKVDLEEYREGRTYKLPVRIE